MQGNLLRLLKNNILEHSLLYTRILTNNYKLISTSTYITWPCVMMRSCLVNVIYIKKGNVWCCLLRFTGAFYPGVPIQPVVIKYTDNRLVSIGQLFLMVIPMHTAWCWNQALIALQESTPIAHLWTNTSRKKSWGYLKYLLYLIGLWLCIGLKLHELNDILSYLVFGDPWSIIVIKRIQTFPSIYVYLRMQHINLFNHCI